MDAPATSLTNQLLVSMPGHPDSSFAHSVALICEHSADRGALGIVVNKPLTMKLGEVMSQMRLTANDEVSERTVLRGGPLHQDRGFVLHRPGGTWDSSHRISEGIQVTTSRDVLAAMSRGEGPIGAFVALGYAGWEAGQLEREIKDNAWLTLPFSEQLLFDLPYEERWLAAWRLMGVDVNQVSLVPGHA